MKLTDLTSLKLGNTSHHDANVVGGPRAHRGWGGSTGSINTDACFSTSVCPRAAVSSRPVLVRVIRKADTGGHTQQPLITVVCW